jgi:hypothetical protein
MNRFQAAAVALLLLSVSIPAFSQGGFFANVTGTVTDSSGALIPGVTVKATAVDTGVVTNAVTNESGAYNFTNLLPGKYTLSATLPGFQTKNITDVQLSQSTSYRFNFELAVSGVNTQVEVSIAADTVLATSGATIGQVLTQQRVSDLPMVGNNVLQLIGVLSGVENATDATFGRENTTFAGISASNITTVRDGIMVQDTRWPTGINSATTINPDLVGEIRLILAPVDAEIGRGNGTVQIQTRSGTNKYTGAAVWSFRNTALDPNSWSNNENQTQFPGVPTNPDGSPSSIIRNWRNVHQGTISFGGPIVRNKTFFYGLYDHNDSRGRGSTNYTVLTPCARNGVIRYFPGINGGNINTTPAGGQTPIAPVVDAFGNPQAPQFIPGTTTPYTGTLNAFSVFGSLPSMPTAADCSDVVNATTLTPNGSPTFWDTYRRAKDSTGYIDRLLGYVPLPNNYEVGDGLNRAGFRWLRHTRGLDNLWGVGEATGLRNQFNVKIDHNFTANHKANVNVSYERVDSDDTVMPYPDTFSNANFRRPLVITSALTSTLSSTLLNEARFGIRRTGTNLYAPWDLEENSAAIHALEPGNINGFDMVFPRFEALTGSGIPFTPSAITGVCNPITGGRPDANAGSGNCFAGALTSTSIDVTPVYTYADTVSWTKGAHSLRFGGELRVSQSKAQVDTTGFFGDYYTTPHAIGGNSQYAPQATTGNGAIAANTPGHPFIPNLGTTDAQVARGLQNYLAGSLSAVRHLAFITDPNDLSTWKDGRTDHLKTTDLRQKEMTVFFKDDYKVTKDLTLNLGMRWEYYGVPYVGSGLTVSPVGGGAAAFGISGRDFTGWMQPGARDQVTALEFVGPSSPNSDKSVYPNDWNNFGPAIGFAWQVPWFGAGRTTVRGGYQVTFQTRGFSTIEGPLSAAPGATYNASYEGQATLNPYLDLTDLSVALPVPISVQPMQPIRIDDRGSSVSFFDANYVTPYVQNLTLSVTRSVRRNMTVDVRYVGTLARKQFTSLPLNSANFLYNGLQQEFDIVREGRENGSNLPVLTQLLSPLTTNPAQFMRISNIATGFGTTIAGDLSNGAYSRIASTLSTTNGTLSVPSGVRGAVLRASGLPENFIHTNPQFSGVTLLNNMGHNNYHSMQAEFTFRPTNGFTGQATYSWSRNLGLPGNFTNPVERALDYTNVGGNRSHQLRTNGTIELPLGPNKIFFGNSSGALARALERWQLGLIYNLSTGAPTSITSNDMLYNNGRPDIVYPVDFNAIRGMKWGTIQSGNFLDGSYFEAGKFLKLDDPQCYTLVTSLDGLNAGNRCTIDALGMIVPAGTPGSFVLSQQFPNNTTFNPVGGTPDTRSAVYVLQHPKPGQRGNFGSNTLMGLGQWRFDANITKAFQISESKTLQLRIDTLNVLNHPEPANPSLSITGQGLFGSSGSKTGGRSFQGQLRFTF